MINEPELPTKKYYLRPRWLFRMLQLTVFLVGVLLVLIDVIPIFMPGLLREKDIVTFILMFPFIFLMFAFCALIAIMFNQYMEINAQGILYSYGSYSSYTPWENIAAIVKFNRLRTNIILKEPAEMQDTISYGRENRVAVIVKHFRWIWIGTSDRSFIKGLIVVPTIMFGYKRWLQPELSVYLEKYAPQVLEQMRESES